MEIPPQARNHWQVNTHTNGVAAEAEVEAAFGLPNRRRRHHSSATTHGIPRGRSFATRTKDPGGRAFVQVQPKVPLRTPHRRVYAPGWKILHGRMHICRSPPPGGVQTETGTWPGFPGTGRRTSPSSSWRRVGRKDDATQ